MNSLSWFLYAADVLGNLQPVLGIVGGLGFSCAALACVMAWSLEDWEPGPVLARRFLLLGTLPCLVIACLIPSKNTMYAMAASEVGERVVMSEQVKGITADATKALQQWIKKQIEPETRK